MKMKREELSMYEDLKRYTQWLGRWVVLAYIVVVLIGKSPMGRDDSDPGAWGARSRLALRTDSRTGCQYLEAMSGGLTPRRDKGGEHIGCR